MGIEKNTGAVDISGKKVNSPVSPETENFHWLKGDKSVITLTRASHDSVQARLAVCSSYDHCHLAGLTMERLLEGGIDKFPHVSSLKDEQNEAVIHLIRSKDVVAFFFDRLWEKPDLSVVRSGEGNANGRECVILVVSPLKNIMIDQIEEMEEQEK